MRAFEVTVIQDNKTVTITLVAKSKKYIKELLKNKYEIISIR